uniref:Uncharacterized protein n=1 Tax=Kalanchoe fedtschenkoi TaxID=63787 RepID=A0A7N0T8E2_KALFE
MEMMFQPPLSSSIHFTVTPDQDDEDHLYKQVLGSQKLMMHPIPGKDPVSMPKESKNIEMLPPPRSSSQFSTVSYVCQSSVLKYVYQRRKPQKQYEFACTGQASINKESGGLYSAVSSDINSVAAGEEKTVCESHPVNLIFGAPDTTPCDVNKIEPLTVISRAMLSSKDLQICGSKGVPERNISLCGLNDTHLSSESDQEIGADYVNINMNDTGKRSSGLLGIENVDKDVSETDFCISFLRSHGLLGHGNIRTSDVVETINGTSDSRICKKCGHSEATSNLLICDRCDDAFHAWCCQPRVIDIPNEDWFCNSCLKIKKKLLKEMRLLQLQKVNEGTSGNSIVETFDDDLSCLDIMLLDAEPHKTEVRVGKGFQADVPELSGPQPSEPNFLGETLAIDLSESETLHNSRLHNPSRVSPIGNWLQCREVIRGVRPDIDGTICGKWRRAPLNDVQTDDWDCFSSVLWNPSHADCAAPQELETEEVMKQLKYIQTLKPSLTGMRRKKSQKRSHTRGRALRGQGTSKDAGNP